MQIWPAIDIRDGKCVRLIQGDYTKQTVYGANPADMALRFVADGATCLHIVDLDGARDGTTANRTSIEKLVAEVNVTCQLGGGIRDELTIESYLRLGVDRLIIGTKALTDFDWFAAMTAKFPEKLLVGIDAREGHAATDGWQKTSDVPATELAAKLSKLSLAGIIYTDITKDGMMSGPNFDAMQEMKSAVDVPLIASGGVTTTEDVTMLAQIGVAGCIIGRSLYEGRLTVASALNAAKHAGIAN